MQGDGRMHPVLFAFKDFEIRTSYVFWFFAVALFIFHTRDRAAKMYGIGRDKTGDAIVWTFFAAAAGALFFDLLGKTHLLLSGDPSFGGFFPAELSSAGGILCGGLAGMYKAHKDGLDLYDFADAAVIPAAASIALWRIGCFFDGCCLGVVPKGPAPYFLLVAYPFDPPGVFRYPYPLMESAFAFFIALLLSVIERVFSRGEKARTSLLAPLFVLLYGAFRLLTNPIREEGLRPGGILTYIFFVLIGAFFWGLNISRSRRIQ